MKTITLVILTTCSFSFVHSQTTWNLAGNTLNGTQKLGSINNADLKIFTNNIQRITIKGNGRVGIGTMAPDNTLHVFKGTAGAVTGNINATLVVENSTHNYINLLAPNASETGILFGKTQNNMSGGIIYNNTSTLNGLQFRTNGNITQMVLTNEGNMGIGVTNPALAKLVTDGAVGNTMAVFGNSLHGISLVNDLPSIGFNAYYNAGWKALNWGFGGIIYLDYNTGDIKIENSSYAGVGGSPITTSESVRFMQNGNVGISGNVGIGTFDPDVYNLRVAHGAYEGGLDIQNSFVSDHWELHTSSNGPLELWFNKEFRGRFDRTSGAYTSVSDERLKTNIRRMSNVLEKINHLKPATYQFIDVRDKQDHDGFIAQDVLQIFPNLVGHNIEPARNLDVYTLDYGGFSVVAIKGIQELSSIIEEQKKQIAELQKSINELKTALSTLTTGAITHNP